MLNCGENVKFASYICVEDFYGVKNEIIITF